jgi:hypothetical protein
VTCLMEAAELPNDILALGKEKNLVISCRSSQILNDVQVQHFSEFYCPPPPPTPTYLCPQHQDSAGHHSHSWCCWLKPWSAKNKVEAHKKKNFFTGRQYCRQALLCNGQLDLGKKGFWGSRARSRVIK